MSRVEARVLARHLVLAHLSEVADELAIAVQLACKAVEIRDCRECREP